MVSRFRTSFTYIFVACFLFYGSEISWHVSTVFLSLLCSLVSTAVREVNGRLVLRGIDGFLTAALCLSLPFLVEPDLFQGEEAIITLYFQPSVCLFCLSLFPVRKTQVSRVPSAPVKREESHTLLQAFLLLHQSVQIHTTKH